MSKIILKFKDGNTINQLQKIIPSATLEKELFGISIIETNVELETALILINDSGLVQYAHVDTEYEILYEPYIPNDENFSDQWALHNTSNPNCDIKASYAWSRLITNAIPVGRSTIHIGILDTGIKYDHPDLALVCDISQGYDFVNNDANPMDDHGHGTHVAGIIGSTGTNSVGTVGVVWNCKLHALKVLDASMIGTDTRILNALQYVDSHNIPIVNLSLGSTSYSQSLRDAIYSLRNKTLFICGSGNNSASNETEPVYPASFDCPNIISVCNTTEIDTLNGTSNWGNTTVDLGAPGDNIISTGLSNDYVYMSGTSMSAPFVSGVAALVLSAKSTLTIQELKDQILNNVDIISGLSGKCVTGGRLNAYKALNNLLTSVISQSSVPEPYNDTNAYVRKNGQWIEETVSNEVIVDDIPVDTNTTHAISSNWAYDHENNLTKHMPDAPENLIYYARRNGTWASFEPAINEVNLSNYFQKTGYTDGVLYGLQNDEWVAIPTNMVDLLPSQSGNNGKYLRTNGSTSSWETVPAQKELIYSIEGEIYKTVFMYYRVPGSATLVSATATLLNRPTGDNVTVDIRKNGVESTNSVFTNDTPITITPTTTVTNGVYIGTGTIEHTAVVANDIIYVMVTGVGSTFKGTDLLVQIILG